MKVRKPAVAGTFYPYNSDELKKTLSQLLEENIPDKNYKDIFGIVSPHAGYVYSGKSAAFAINAIKNQKFTTAIVISPSHREYFKGVSIYNGDFYETPLGKIEIDKELSDQFLSGSESIFYSEQGHRNEHALEVQLPFLQMINENFKLVPLVIGDQGKKYIDELASKLAEVRTLDSIIIASSDLSHFYSREIANNLDSNVENRINRFEYNELLEDLVDGKSEACGGGGIVALMKAADICGFTKAEVISRTDSGDVSGDISGVVGYLSAVLFR
ncbi:MAG: AmmeMemoRadiSam system protein B [Bacteroidetes bacterium]|nr:AmmeMemoRadiSam system protein B [Bacteroidota bacterium]MBU1680697.1 AmmeMemoRadiSam system protein B [Bacteroidota bacterium]MBU2505206.1 AmmeMemoRadiSam system protein B [Bacteroidota bacterium]